MEQSKESLQSIQNSYNEAKKLYAQHGIDVDKVLQRLAEIKISLHCWQGDDVKGFLNKEKELSGGIAVTGSYPGRAGNRRSCAVIWNRPLHSSQANIK